MKQHNIDRKLREAYQKIDTEREPVCQGCGRGDLPLSHSHTISRKRCKELGRPELIFDPDNIELECFGATSCCHEIWEGGTYDSKTRLKNFDRKLKYIEQHDPERHRILTLCKPKAV